MRLIMLGAPGVGKGTQADLLSARFARPKISTGDMLREAVRNKTPLGLEAKACMDQGKLVPDGVVIGIVQDKLAEPLCEKGFILDGFPRTVPQAEALNELLDARRIPLDRVINITVPREEIIRRLTGRRSCSACSAVFHLDFAPPARAEICDRCGGRLIQRSDDSRETVEARLSVYERQTAPLIDYYRGRNLLDELDGQGPVDEVQRRMLGLLHQHGIA